MLAAAALWLIATRGIEVEPGPEAWIGLGQSLSFFLGLLLLLFWMHRANSNARALGARDMIVTPVWAVGWWFVPVANLVMPFVTVREVWKASANPADWEAEKAPAAIGLWWGLWLISGIAGIVSFQLIWRGGIGAYDAGRSFLMASDAAYVGAAVLTARLVGWIEAMQSRHVPAATFRSGAIAGDDARG